MVGVAAVVAGAFFGIKEASKAGRGGSSSSSSSSKYSARGFARDFSREMGSGF